MSIPSKTLADKEVSLKHPAARSGVPEATPRLQRKSLSAWLPRGGLNPRALVKGAVLQLQRLIGNRAVGRLIQRDDDSPEARVDEDRATSEPENKTGLPDNLKSGIESLSGLALDDVRVHYNSPQPARLNALAYARGTDIYIGPGQERHLPHEAWHVVQQKQGRVQPTSQINGAALDDSPDLEQEADEMSARALSAPAASLALPPDEPKTKKLGPTSVVQLTLAQIDYAVGDNNTHVNGDNVGMGGVGGVSDSEQTAWNRARAGILAQLGHAGRQVDIEFSVDTQVCDGCARWFEDTIHPLLTQRATANGSSFTLTVEVNGNRVTIDGDETIWTPEVADTHTFDRLSAMERSLRYLRENRDEDGDVRAAARGAYLDDQLERLEGLLAAYEHNDLDLDSIETELVEGKRQAVAFIGDDVYNNDANNLTPEAYLDTISFADILFSGRFAISGLPTHDEEGNVLETQAARITQWHQNLQQDFKFYMTQAIEEHFEDYLIVEDPEENPHHRLPGQQ